MVVSTALLLLVTGWNWPVSGTALTLGEQRCFFRSPHFTTHWIHSVEKEAWQENYLRQDRNFVLTSTRFKTFGAGTPYDGHQTLDGKGYVVRPVNRLLPELYWVVSRQVDSALLIEGKTWPLAQWTENHTVAHLRPATRSLGSLFFGKDYCYEQLRKNSGG